MKITETEQGCYRASFWLFGHEIVKEFETEKEALIFFENLKANYVTELFSIKSGIDKYLITVSSQKHPSTYKWEHHIFQVLMVYLRSQGIDKTDPLTKITISELESFQIYLKNEGLSPSTVNRYFSTIKHFFSKLERWGMIVKRPTRHVSKLPEKPRQKGVWSDELFEKVKINLNPQDRDLFTFLRLTGARLSSATRLKIQDVDFDNMLLSFSSKKGSKAQEKVYLFPIYDKLLIFLKPVVERRQALEITHDYLFTRSDGAPFNSKNFAKRVRKVLSKIGANRNDGEVMSLHGLRHTMASVLHDGGMTINEIKELLGHSSVTITEGYLHSDRRQILNKINKIA